MALQDRLRPWHALLLAVFLAGGGTALLRADALAMAPILGAVVTGLLAVVVFQFTVGNVWAYAVEYRNAGGGWSDAPFLAPFVVGVVSGATVLVATNSPAAAAWAAFWAFVVVAAVTTVAVWLAVGYRDTTDSEPVG